MSSKKTRIALFTKSFRIKGDIDLIPGARLTDFMNETKKFMVVTDATVTDYSGKELARSKFVNVCVKNIEFILPADRLS